jgi:predicted Rossmann fold nucleotide-binding protein DprA/Smf involved in DNA uptake
MTSWNERWYDEEAGPLVRLYARTGGRTVARRDDFELSTMICCAPDAAHRPGLSSEQSTILRLSREPVSTTEIAAHLGMPIGPVRVLLGELRDAGLIVAPQVRPADADPSRPVLERLLSGLRAL